MKNVDVILRSTLNTVVFVLHFVAACCSAVHGTRGCDIVSYPQHCGTSVAVCFSVLQCVAVCCSVLQCVAVWKTWM